MAVEIKGSSAWLASGELGSEAVSGATASAAAAATAALVPEASKSGVTSRVLPVVAAALASRCSGRKESALPRLS